MSEIMFYLLILALGLEFIYNLRAILILQNRRDERERIREEKLNAQRKSA